MEEPTSRSAEELPLRLALKPAAVRNLLKILREVWQRRDSESGQQHDSYLATASLRLALSHVHHLLAYSPGGETAAERKEQMKVWRQRKAAVVTEIRQKWLQQLVPAKPSPIALLLPQRHATYLANPGTLSLLASCGPACLPWFSPLLPPFPPALLLPMRRHHATRSLRSLPAP